MELDVILVAVRRRWPIIVAALVAGVLLAMLFPSNSTDRFESTALVLARPSTNLTSPALDAQPDRYVQGEIAVIGGSSVRAAVEQRVDGNIPDDVSFTQIDSSDIISIAVVTGDAERSQQVAQAFAEEYVAQAQGLVDDAFRPELDRLEGEVTRIEGELTTVNETLAAAARPYLAAATNAENPQPIPDVTVLDPSAAAEQGILIGDLQRAQTELSTTRNEARSAFRTELIEPANMPAEPLADSSGLVRIGLVVMFGLLGLAAAIMATRFSGVALDRRTIEETMGRRTDIELERSPSMSESRSSDLSARPLSVQSELDRLAALVELSRSQNRTTQPTLVAIGGATVDSGSTTTAIQLAATLARRGASTLLIDGDLERNDVTVRLNAKTNWGEKSKPVQFASSLDDLLVAGNDGSEAAPDIIEIVASVNDHKSLIDVVVVDVGNVLRSAVAAQLAPGADRLVLCVPEHGQSKRALEQAAQMYTDTDNVLLAVTGARGPMIARSTDSSSKKTKTSSATDSSDTRRLEEAA